MGNIEILATAAVKNALARSELFYIAINENDKLPSFDGEVIIKSNHKQNAIHKISVQVKGKDVSKTNTLKTTSRNALQPLLFNCYSRICATA